jgi:hypothetical protein
MSAHAAKRTSREQPSGDAAAILKKVYAVYIISSHSNFIFET